MRTGAAAAAAVRTAPRRRIALVAHDDRRRDLLDWARLNRATLGSHELFATGTTGMLLASELGVGVVRLGSGPPGDPRVAAGIADVRLDLVVFFWDPLEPHPHDVDVRALLRVAVAHDVPIACTPASADLMLSSPFVATDYARLLSSLDERRWHPELAVASVA